MEIPKKNDILELEITGISFEGKGIARIKIEPGNDFVIFTDGAVTRDTVKVNIAKVKKNYAEAKLIEVIKPSPYRTEPKCRHFGICNGCKFQNLQYESQLELKRNNVLNAFERIGGFQNLYVPPVIGSDEIFHYRNKLEFSFSENRWLTDTDISLTEKEKNFALGFHKPGFADKVVDIDTCYLQSEITNRILNFTKDFFKKKNTSIY